VGRQAYSVSVDPLREELLQPHAPAWQPNPGEVLIGEIVDLDERTGFAGGRYTVVIVKTDEGERWAFHAFHAVAAAELEKQQPAVGDRFGVAYHGLVRKGDQRYESYRLRVVKGPDPDWAAIRAEAEQAQEAAVESGTEPDEDDIPF
jgi:hypothetical protein